MKKDGRVLVFDIGGVLYENIGFDVLRQLMPQRSEQEVRSVWLNSPTVDSFETGKMPPQQFAEAVVTELDFDLSPQQFIEEFATWPKGFYDGAVELVAALRQHYTVVCFSNSNVLHWREEFDSMFDIALASHRIGVAKPKPAAFNYLIKAVAVPADRLYFFDDSQTNIDAGVQSGLQARLSFGFEGLLKALDAEGIRSDGQAL